MPLFAESEEKILGEILFDIVESTNITRASPGSKMRAFAQAVSRKMGRMYTTFDLNVGSAFLDGAEGKFLNYIGDMMGVQRLGEEAAKVTSLDRNVKFYTALGTFGDLNGGNSILIPAGTLVTTGPNSTGVKYRVLVNTILLSTDDEAYVSVESLRTGSSANVGPKQLIYHNFTDYSDSNNDSLLVTNDGDVITGQDIEIDSNYRFRIANQILNLEKANSMAIRLAVLGVPGVADLVLIPYARGVGTFDILVKATTPSISDSLVATIQESVSNTEAFGVIGTVRPPVEVGVSLVGSMTYRRALSTQEETNIINLATDNVTTYINSLDIGEDLVLNEVLERVMATSDLIKSLGTPTLPFDNVWIHKPSKLEDNKVRSTLIQDYSPAEDERVIVENRYAGNTPILLRSA